jgi:hypothetical protein
MSRTPNTPFIPPLPASPDGSPGPEHPPVIPMGTPNWNPPVANGGGYAPFASPNTPFIAPLPASPDNSPGPEHPPAIPTGTPNWNPPVANGGGYTPFASPYLAHSPYVPNLSPMVTPGVIPGMFSPPPKVNRLGISEDFTGYPPDSGGVPPMSSPNQQPFYSPYSSHSNSLPNSPYYPQSAPAAYQGFGTPWNSNVAQLPSSPWGGFPSFGNYGPPPPPTGPPPPMMGGPPPPRMGNIPPPQNMPPPRHFGQQSFNSFRTPLEPPSQIYDRLDPFEEGKSCTSTCSFPMFIAQRRDFD